VVGTFDFGVGLRFDATEIFKLVLAIGECGLEGGDLEFELAD
jgi:hypothetical protein